MNRSGRFSLAFAMLSLLIVLGAAIVAAHAVSSPPEDKAFGIIFCDDFESGDTSAWESDDCSSTLDMPLAVTE